MSGPVKAAVIGAVVAAGLVVALVVVVSSGLLQIPIGGSASTKVLVVAAAPDESGTELAALAFVVDPATGQVALLDTLENATVSGTSATNAREALPFGGGDAVATALMDQTGGDKLDWIVVPSKEWAEVVDEAGGITVDVPQDVSAYARGRLTVLEAGTQKLSGAEAVAVATAIGNAGSADEQRTVLKQLSAGVSALTGSSGAALRDLVSQSKADSSLDPAEIPDLSSVR